MSTSVLICDDSSIARRQLAKALPTDWNIEIEYAVDGQEALDIIESKPIDVLFLDLNMPIRDGYQTLAALQDVPDSPYVFVVSGDVQPIAVQRVKELGALEFHKKPIRSDVMRESLLALNLMISDKSADHSSIQNDFSLDQFSLFDCLQEVSNVAMGLSASVLADMLNVFIKLPVPSVNVLEVSELQMALGYGAQDTSFSAISQGYVGAGVSLEALLIFSDTSFADMAMLLGMKGQISKKKEVELLMDVYSVLVGPYMDALGHQMDISFSYGHPLLLGQHVRLSNLIDVKKSKWKRMLTVEIVYEVENYNISCDLLLLFTEDSLPALEKLLSYLVED